METWYLLLTRVEYISYNEKETIMKTKDYKLLGFFIILLHPELLLYLMLKKIFKF
jgi:hypothetical protein